MHRKENQENSDLKKLDIRGKKCPLTYVYTKVTLEKMKKGELLEIILDFPPAVKNIPQSAERQGLGVLISSKEINHIEKEWLLILERL